MGLTAYEIVATLHVSDVDTDDDYDGYFFAIFFGFRGLLYRLERVALNGRMENQNSGKINELDHETKASTKPFHSLHYTAEWHQSRMTIRWKKEDR